MNTLIISPTYNEKKNINELIEKIFTLNYSLHLLIVDDNFEKVTIKRNDGLFQYLVYLSELKMMNRITIRHSLKNHSMHHFKIYLFMDEDRLKQKIRLELVDSHIGQ